MYCVVGYICVILFNNKCLPVLRVMAHGVRGMGGPAYYDKEYTRKSHFVQC